MIFDPKQNEFVCIVGHGSESFAAFLNGVILQQKKRSSALAWNSAYRSVLERPNSDLTTKISHFKDEIKKLLSYKKNEGENIDWQKSNFILY